MKITDQQKKVLDFIRENGGAAVPQGGGFWAAANGCLINVPNATRTIYALAERGLLTRTYFYKQSWRDTYAIADDDSSIAA